MPNSKPCSAKTPAYSASLSMSVAISPPCANESRDTARGLDMKGAIRHWNNKQYFSRHVVPAFFPFVNDFSRPFENVRGDRLICMDER